MTRQQLQIYSDKLYTECMSIMLNKGKDYNKEEDVFAAFKSIANITWWKQEEVCLSYLLKHIDKIIRVLSRNGKTHGESLQETIKDSINYLILLYGMINEFPKD